MFKLKKILIKSITLIFILLFIIELILYLKTNSNIFGLYYLLSSLVLIFFLVPVAYNYKRNYSKARISKIIIIILIGIFTSFFLEKIVLNTSYIDNSKTFIDKIYIIKNIIRPILYCTLLLFLVLETKVYLLLKKIHLPKSKKS